jgi:hypothetical protein
MQRLCLQWFFYTGYCLMTGPHPDIGYTPYIPFLRTLYSLWRTRFRSLLCRPHHRRNGQNYHAYGIPARSICEPEPGILNEREAYKPSAVDGHRLWRPIIACVHNVVSRCSAAMVEWTARKSRIGNIEIGRLHTV